MDADENRAREQGNTFKESLAAEVEADADEHDCCILFTEQSCLCLLALLCEGMQKSCRNEACNFQLIN